ncbi:ABC transporter substrate-binding protein [Nitratireductor thuwali]|uniref:Fe/B12 periplasmic-binding domain-containing protein n=1 Tax=Nitratireductor thuwali TaxID=2267699 RepID=A0ABY5MJT5_9HYPH|nr:hypothetical protein NTH_01856 [Nitratireductor thuwali]
MYLKHIVGGFLFALSTLVAAHAEEVTVTDVAGREVTLDVPVKRVLLGEGRQVHALAAIRGDKVFDDVIAWRDDLMGSDADSYALYRAFAPQIADLPRFGYIPTGTFDVEAAIALDPGVIILNLEQFEAARESGFFQFMDAAGVPVVFVDFRADLDKNGDPSLRLLGKLFDVEEKAEEYIAFRHEQLGRVTDVLEKAKPEKPVVLLYRAPGISSTTACCKTFGSYNFGRMIEQAGGINVGSAFGDTTYVDINPEQVIASDPEHVIVTGANWESVSDIQEFVSVGPGAPEGPALKRLASLVQAPAFTGIRAVREGKVHAIWHQFYNNPYDYVAVQRFAKWFYPELFADLDPDATFRELHERFLPVGYRPGYWVSLSGNMN